MPENTTAPAPGGRRVIKKYPNRRLYDTRASAYIALAEVRQLVVDGHHVQVLDAKSGADLTRSILLQIILEEEAAGAPIFSELVLTHIIRFYGHAMQGHIGPYLEKNVQMLADLQQRLAGHIGPMPAVPGAWPPWMGMPNMMGHYLEQSRAAFSQMQEQMLRSRPRPAQREENAS